MRFVKAGRAGFEPAAEFKAQHSLSRRAQSASLAPPQENQLFLAEGVGFEPTMDCSIPVFKTGALGRSAIPPFPGLLRQQIFSFTVDVQAQSCLDRRGYSTISGDGLQHSQKPDEAHIHYDQDSGCAPHRGDQAIVKELRSSREN